jgi:hypothetical protein
VIRRRLGATVGQSVVRRTARTPAQARVAGMRPDQTGPRSSLPTALPRRSARMPASRLPANRRWGRGRCRWAVAPTATRGASLCEPAQERRRPGPARSGGPRDRPPAATEGNARSQPPRTRPGAAPTGAGAEWRSAGPPTCPTSPTVRPQWRTRRPGWPSTRAPSWSHGQRGGGSGAKRARGPWRQAGTRAVAPIGHAGRGAKRARGPPATRSGPGATMAPGHEADEPVERDRPADLPRYATWISTPRGSGRAPTA